MDWKKPFGIPWHEDWKVPGMNGADGPLLPHTTLPLEVSMLTSGYDPVYQVNNPGWIDADSVVRRWYRNGVLIPGATGTTYATSNWDNGDQIRVEEDGINIYGTTTASSTNLTLVRPMPTVLPVIAGNAGAYHNHGITVSGTDGTWDNAIGFTYQWYHNGNPIPGETNSTFVIPITFVEGDTLDLIVTAYSIEGVEQIGLSNTLVCEVPSELTTVVIQALTGANNVGDQLSVQTAAVFSNGATVTRQWYRTPGGAISGQTGTSYTLVSGDQGLDINLQYVGTNSYGDSNSISNTITVGFVPVNVIAPVISGWSDGTPIRVTTTPTWTFATSTAGQWVRNGVDVVGQTGTTYSGTTVNGDSILYRASGINIYGTTNVNSNAIAVGLGFANTNNDALLISTFSGIKGLVKNNAAQTHDMLLNASITGTKTP